MLSSASTGRTPQMRVRPIPRAMAVRAGVPPLIGAFSTVDDDRLVGLDAFRRPLGARHTAW